MKLKLSISMDKDLISKINNKLKDYTFRNKSHLIEFAVKKLLEEQNG